jgi:hypothetical protein
MIAIQGGLGNQLFQWFYAHSVLDSSRFRLFPIFPQAPKINPIRELEVSPLIAGCKHIEGLVESHGFNLGRSLLALVFGHLWKFPQLSTSLHLLGYFREDPRSDTRSHAQPPTKIRYAEGYFLDWRFPNSQLEVVRSELLPILSKVFESLALRFSLEPPFNVIHVRNWTSRVEQDPRTTMGTLSDDYYLQWVKNHPSERLIILTEKRSEIEDLISVTQPALVLDQSSTNAWETLAIMSHAEFILGSNSTLSWWGVWTAHLFGGKGYLPAEFDKTPGRFENSKFLFPSCNAVKPIWKVHKLV